MPAFVHEPLHTTQRQIRVLRVRQGGQKDLIECDLQHVDVDEAQHVCLSYVWGDTDTRHDIRINDGTFAVRPNLFEFLTLAKRLKITDWLWIDAVCILQENHAETNHQIQLMGQIYRSAKRTLVYTGHISQAKSQILHGSMRVGREFIVTGPVSLARQFLAGWPFIYASKEIWVSEYWQRMWIKQEILLSKEICLVSNIGILDFDKLPLGDFMDEPPGQLLSERRLRLGNPRTGAIDRRRRANNSILELVFQFSKDGECSVEHDRLYALLGLAQPSPDIMIDYDKPLAAVTMSLISQVLEREFLPHHFVGNLVGQEMFRRETIQLWHTELPAKVHELLDIMRLHIIRSCIHGRDGFKTEQIGRTLMIFPSYLEDSNTTILYGQEYKTIWMVGYPDHLAKVLPACKDCEMPVPGNIPWRQSGGVSLLFGCAPEALVA